MREATKSIFGQVAKFVEAQTRSGDVSFNLPADVISHFERNGVEPTEIYKIVGPQEELAPLIKDQRELSHEQTDRASRLAYIIDLAEKVFGRREKAFMWLRLQNTQFGNRAPIECLAREAGSRSVEESLLRIQHGIYA